jgi:uncharacterized protein YdeI (YjbR/CyaY-like superfamily)
LSKHHKSRRGIWLVFHKKSSREPSIDYNESVEEAICYGWIDGQIKRIDEQKYVRRFAAAPSEEHLVGIQQASCFENAP